MCIQSCMKFSSEKFMIILNQWLETLVENTRRYRTTTMKNWIPKLVRMLNSISNKTSLTFYFYLDSITRGYITESVVHFSHSCNVAEWDLFRVLHGRFMK
jgi:hypothetical protein